MKCILFSIEQQRFAFDLSYVNKVIQAVEITNLPNAPSHVMGAINMHGSVISVISLRKLLNIAIRKLELTDQFIVCQPKDKLIALWVDDVKGVIDYAEDKLVPAQDIFPELLEVDFVVKEKESFTLLYNLLRLLPEHAL